MTDLQREKLFEYYKKNIIRRRLVDLEAIKPTTNVINNPKDMTYENWVWFVNT